MADSNPLLLEFNGPFGSVPFNQIKLEHFQEALTKTIEITRNHLSEIANNQAMPTFENTILALEESDADLSKVSSAFYHLFAAHSNDEMQKVMVEFSVLLAQLSNDTFLNPQLFTKVKAVLNTEQDNEKKYLAEFYYKKFKRNGAELDDAKKNTLRNIDQELSAQFPQFSDNVLKATNDFILHIKDEESVAALPEAAKLAAMQEAKSRDLEGYVFTLQAPSFLPFVTYCHRRNLRKELTEAYGRRAFKDQYDNQAVIRKTIELRTKRAKLIGFDTYADYALDDRMAKQVSKVNEFLDTLLNNYKDAAHAEIKTLSEMLDQDEPGATLMPWDVRFYSEKLKKEKYSFDQETLRPYFSLDKVMKGIFEVAHKLYNLEFKPIEVDLYHEDVKTYEVVSDKADHAGLLYVDLFPRESKNAGAWMTEIRPQGLYKGKNRRPHVALVCNFSKPVGDQPALLSFDEVNTLFHEFGHGLHALLSTVKYPSIAGTHVDRDFVELPSQIMENWLTEKETLDIFAEHYETKEKISDDLIDKIKKQRTFMMGYATLRQLSFAYLDMAWHTTDINQIKSFEDFEQKAMKPTQLMPHIENTNFSCGFGHIFAGGYAAGYYSYKWAEVLDADAFSYFQEKGIFNKEIARSFRDTILAKGNSQDPIDLFIQFRGREPKTEALLKRDGIFN